MCQLTIPKVISQRSISYKNIVFLKHTNKKKMSLKVATGDGFPNSITLK